MKLKVNVIYVQVVEAFMVEIGWGSHIFRYSAAFYPQEDSWYSFLLEAESTPGL
jgi:hypothetical protein